MLVNYCKKSIFWLTNISEIAYPVLIRRRREGVDIFLDKLNGHSKFMSVLEPVKNFLENKQNQGLLYGNTCKIVEQIAHLFYMLERKSW